VTPPSTDVTGSSVPLRRSDPVWKALRSGDTNVSQPVDDAVARALANVADEEHTP